MQLLKFFQEFSDEDFERLSFANEDYKEVSNDGTFKFIGGNGGVKNEILQVFAKNI